ncbi:MAG: response regulator [Cellulosilyticum sp.]|nr:response regulator [Cellulosilyticum sp.]
MQDYYHIMIIEDDPNMADELAHLLEGWGYKISSVKDFANIIEKAVQIKPQAILLDINLPCFDGLVRLKSI